MIRCLLISSLVVSCCGLQELSAQQSGPKFELLSAGNELVGWKHSGNWKIEDGVISRQGRGGSLVYSEKVIPDDFELQFEWKVARGSNSGVYYRPGQYEYQILDNDAHSDGQNPRTSAASLYFCMQPSADLTRPVGEWNDARIVCKASVIQHWLNGTKVVDFDYKDPRWAFNVNMLKLRGAELEERGGRLSLQDHGDPVWFRNVRLREIPSDEDIHHSTVQPAEISAEVLLKEKTKLDGIVTRRNKNRKKKPAK